MSRPWIVALTLPLLLVSACKSSTDFCDYDSECPIGKVCLGSLCVPPPDDDADASDDVAMDVVDEGEVTTDTDALECEAGESRSSGATCGLNGRGTTREVCEDGLWVGGECDDPDACEDGATESLEIACGLNDRGVLEQECVEGGWTDPLCVDPDTCDDDATREDPEACGTNGRGTLPWTCVDGQWLAAACVDDDACTDGETAELANTCGLNTRGTQTQRCEAGAWMVLGGCDDPDVCVDGEVADPTDICGLNGRGRVVPTCAVGQWEDVCVDGDECVDDEERTALCWQAMGTRPEACAEGRWYPLQGCALDGVVRVSVGVAGELDGASTLADVSDDGRYVLFASEATNAVSDDANELTDLFRYDFVTGEVVRVTVGHEGQEATDELERLSGEMSSDGQRVVFASRASNLVPHDINLMVDIFVRDLTTNATTRVNVNNEGLQTNGHSWEPTISGDGGTVAFASRATNLTDDAVDHASIYVRRLGNDLLEPTTTLASRGLDGAPDADSDVPRLAIRDSPLFFESSATNLTPATSDYSNTYAQQAGVNALVAVTEIGDPSDRGTHGYVISRNGDWVLFDSSATNLGGRTEGWAYQTYLRNLSATELTYVAYKIDGSFADGYVTGLAVSDDGRFVVFASSNAVGLDADYPTLEVPGVFVRDMETGETQLLGSALAIANGHVAIDALVTPDGRHIVFTSASPDLVPGDTNDAVDVFMMPTPGYAD